MPPRERRIDVKPGDAKVVAGHGIGCRGVSGPPSLAGAPQRRSAQHARGPRFARRRGLAADSSYRRSQAPDGCFCRVIAGFDEAVIAARRGAGPKHRGGRRTRPGPGEIAMTISRVLPLVLAFAVLPLVPAAAQFGGMPGMPGSPGMPGAPGMSGSPFGAAPARASARLSAAPGPAGRDFQAWSDAAGRRQEEGRARRACKLFKVFLASETKMITGLEEHRATCGVPVDIIKQVKASHGKSAQVRASRSATPPHRGRGRPVPP